MSHILILDQDDEGHCKWQFWKELPVVGISFIDGQWYWAWQGGWVTLKVFLSEN